MTGRVAAPSYLSINRDLESVKVVEEPLIGCSMLRPYMALFKKR